jgi:hypothetical protein
MAVRIELWIDGRVVDGAEQWWDDIEAALAADDRKAEFPMLGRVDAYGDVLFEREELGALAADVRRFMSHAPESVRPFLERLTELCEAGDRGTAAELRFLGD